MTYLRNKAEEKAARDKKKKKEDEKKAEQELVRMSTMKGSNTDGGGKRGRVMSDESVKPTDISISRQNTTGNV